MERRAFNYLLYLTAQETEAQRGEVPSPRSQNWGVEGPGLEPNAVDQQECHHTGDWHVNSLDAPAAESAPCSLSLAIGKRGCELLLKIPGPETGAY